LKSTKKCDNELFSLSVKFFVDPGHGLTKEKKLIKNIAYRAKFINRAVVSVFFLILTLCDDTMENRPNQQKIQTNEIMVKFTKPIFDWSI
jgi:hypothetical protein